jgi:phospholipid/cholesterol/gamma-HCH transport system substrate-binding protein
MKLRIKYADQVVGAFILLAIAALALALIFIGLNQRWFAKDYTFRSEFPSASGISPGTSINFRGFVIGKVASVMLNARNMVDVTLIIYDTYYDRVREHSLLELSISPIGLGDKLSLLQGRGSGTLPEGAFIPRADSFSGKTLIKHGLVDVPAKDDTVSNILASVGPLLNNANAAVVTLNRTLTEVNYALAGQGTGPIASMLQNADASVAALRSTLEDDVPMIVSDVRSVTAGAGQAVADVQGILAKVDGIMAKVDGIGADVKKLTESIADPTGLVPKLLDPKGSIKTLLDDQNALYDRITGLLGEVHSTMSTLDTMVRRLNNEMPGISVLLEEGKGTLVKAQDVLEGLRNNPILKGGITERKEQEALFRSLRDEEF